MKVSMDKKQAIILYILDKIYSGSKSVSKEVSKAFGMSPNTVHTYLNELIGELQSIVNKLEKKANTVVSESASGEEYDDLTDNSCWYQVVSKDS